MLIQPSLIDDGGDDGAYSHDDDGDDVANDSNVDGDKDEQQLHDDAQNESPSLLS